MTFQELQEKAKVLSFEELMAQLTAVPPKDLMKLAVEGSKVLYAPPQLQETT